MAGRTRATKVKRHPTKKTTAGKRANARPAASGATMEAFVASLKHPLQREILALRRIILGAAPEIAEEIKWNAPSFYTSEHFATFHLRARDVVQVILHRGARPRADTKAGLAIDDPESLLKWLGPDRASARFRDLAQITAERAAFTKIIRQWIRHV
jgi:hypothetical protein